MSPVALKVALAGILLLLLLLLGAAGGAWKVQDWRYGKQLAEQSGLHQADVAAISNAAADQARVERDKHLVLEQRLSASEQIHYKELSDAQTTQARLRDRLATSDLRLSVVLSVTNTASGHAVPATTSAGCVVHGAPPVELNPAHAQRIVGITNAGDQGLIALAACQAYAKEVSTPK